MGRVVSSVNVTGDETFTNGGVLVRAFTVSTPNEVWCRGITYVWAQGRWCYLEAVIDLFARRVVGWAFSSKPDSELVINALDMVYEKRGRPQNVLSPRPRQAITAAEASVSDGGVSVSSRA